MAKFLDARGVREVVDARDLDTVRMTGQIFSDDCFLDEVVGIDARRHVGPVYNLETESGYYIAQGVISHNCKCSCYPWFDERYAHDTLDEGASGATGAAGGSGSGAASGGGNSGGGMQSALGFSLPGGPGGTKRRKRKVVKHFNPDDTVDEYEIIDYDPDQPRDYHGRWGTGGSPEDRTHIENALVSLAKEFGEDGSAVTKAFGSPEVQKCLHAIDYKLEPFYKGAQKLHELIQHNALLAHLSRYDSRR
jgi:hypothetical protein